MQNFMGRPVFSENPGASEPPVEHLPFRIGGGAPGGMSGGTSVDGGGAGNNMGQLLTMLLSLLGGKGPQAGGSGGLEDMIKKLQAGGQSAGFGSAMSSHQAMSGGQPQQMTPFNGTPQLGGSGPMPGMGTPMQRPGVSLAQLTRPGR